MLNGYKEIEITYFVDFKYIHKQRIKVCFVEVPETCIQICFIPMHQLHLAVTEKTVSWFD